MINRCFVLLLLPLLLGSAAFAAQHVSIRPKPIMDSGDQETIREIIEMERQAKEASLHRDAEFSQKSLADDYVAITPLGQVTTKQDTVSARKSGQLRYEAINVTDMSAKGSSDLPHGFVHLGNRIR